MVQLLRHPQTKGRATDRLNLNHRATSRLYPQVVNDMGCDVFVDSLDVLESVAEGCKNP